MSTDDPRPKSKSPDLPKNKRGRGAKKAVTSTPATVVLANAGLPYALHVVHDDPGQTPSTSRRAQRLGMDSRRLFRTVITLAGKDLVAVALPAVATLDLQALAFATGHHHAEVASDDQVAQAGGYDAAHISPLGLSEDLPLVLDVSAMTFRSILISSGLPDLDIEIAPQDLVNELLARTAPIARF